MAKDDHLSKKQAQKRRDDTLKRMLQTPPRLHKDEPKRSVVARTKKPRDAGS